MSTLGLGWTQQMFWLLKSYCYVHVIKFQGSKLHY